MASKRTHHKNKAHVWHIGKDGTALVCDVPSARQKHNGLRVAAQRGHVYQFAKSDEAGLRLLLRSWHRKHGLKSALAVAKLISAARRIPASS